LALNALLRQLRDCGDIPIDVTAVQQIPTSNGSGGGGNRDGGDPHHAAGRRIGYATTWSITTSVDELHREIMRRVRTQQELQVAKQQAETANTAKSRFLANVSHEIRTPLNAIIGMSDILSRGEAGNLSATQREGLDILHRSSRRLLSLINDVLDLSKIESGKMEVKLAPVSVEALIAGMETMIHTLIGAKAIDLFLQKSREVPATIVSDGEKLTTILTNILGNAVKFTDQGEIVLKVFLEEDRLHFRVSDTGIGIPAEHLTDIFDEFTQVDSSTTRKYPGTGLGLAISRRMAELLGGRIWAESTVGEGTVVTFFVPLRTPAAGADTSSGPPPVRSGRCPGRADPAGPAGCHCPVIPLPKMTSSAERRCE
jgi:signal transduction histidine kinase